MLASRNNISKITEKNRIYTATACYDKQSLENFLKAKAENYNISIADLALKFSHANNNKDIKLLIDSIIDILPDEWVYYYDKVDFKKYSHHIVDALKNLKPQDSKASQKGAKSLFSKLINFGSNLWDFLSNNKTAFLLLIPILSAAKQLKTNDLNYGLVGHWPLDGNAKDKSGYNNHGTVYGANSTTGIDGTPNGAYHFDGLNSYISLAESSPTFLDSLNEGTITFWIRPDFSINSNKMIFSFTNIASIDENIFLVEFLDGADPRKLLITFVHEGLTVIRTTANYDFSENWSFFAYRYDSIQHQIFTNNTWYDISTTIVFLNDLVDGSNLPNKITIGAIRDSRGTISMYSGSIGEVRIYNRPLSTSEIQMLLQAKKNTYKYIWWMIIAGVSSTLPLCIVVTTMGVCLYKRNKNQQKLKIQRLNNSKHIDQQFKWENFLVNYQVPYDEIKTIEEIGAGASATVYKAKWKNTIVAYKVSPVVDPAKIKDFEVEAGIMLESNHPNIVRLYRVCIRPNSFGLLMEYMEMGTLKEVLSKRTVILTWDSKWNIAYDLATALEFLHGKKIYHRDIKTDNVLLYKESDEIHAKMADFGLSKIKETEESATMAIGTYRYMAPEMTGINEAINEKYGIGKFPIDKVDVYALGMTLFALIIEEEPFHNVKNAMNIPVRVFREEKELVQEIPQGKCPLRFFELTNRCKDCKDPEKRPSAEIIVKKLNDMKDDVINFVPQ